LQRNAAVVIIVFLKLHTLNLGPHWNSDAICWFVTEALIFAFRFEPVDDELDWTLVYPELANGEGK
jgi:hypothetical protein